MTAKEFLSGYGGALDRLAVCRERIVNAERTARGLDRASTDRYISDYQDRLYEECEELYKYVTAAENAVWRCFCSETERKVLYKRYIFREKWEQIAKELNYSVQHVHRLSNSALKKLRVPEEYKTPTAL